MIISQLVYGWHVQKNYDPCPVQGQTVNGRESVYLMLKCHPVVCIKHTIPWENSFLHRFPSDGARILGGTVGALDREDLVPTEAVQGRRDTKGVGLGEHWRGRHLPGIQ